MARAKRKSEGRRSQQRGLPQRHGGVLRPFRPGESGNPGGRPRQGVVSEALRALLAAAGGGRDGVTLAEALARTLVDHAERGNLHALREILGRTEGRWPTAADAARRGGDLQAVAAAWFLQHMPDRCPGCHVGAPRCAKCGTALSWETIRPGVVDFRRYDAGEEGDSGAASRS